MPTHNIENVIEDPPKLTNGIGIPVMGIKLVTAAIFINACTTMIAVTPAANSLPYMSFVPMAIRIPA